MRKIIYSLFAAIIILVGCTDKNTFEITGKVTGFNDSTMLYLDDVENEKTVDSTYIINGQFIFHGNLTEPSQFVIRNDYKKRDDFEYKFLWVETGKITLVAEKGSFQKAKITGSQLQDEAEILVKMKQPYENKMDSIRQYFMTVDRNDTATINKLRWEHEALMKKSDEVVKSYIKENPGFINSALNLTFAMYDLPKEEVLEIFNNLNEEVKNSKYGKIVKKYCELSKKFKIGDKADDFKLPDIKGNEIGLSDFKGKYVLLEFWGSGCGPCRMTNPHLLKAYKKYKDKGFEILSVSVDKNRENWEEAIKKDSMIWTNVADLKGIHGNVPTTFSVNYIPRSFLIDLEGIIIAEDLRGGQLDEKLNEIFNN